MAREFGDRCATRVSTGAAQDALNPPPLHVLSPVHAGPKSKMTKVMKAGACFSGDGGGLLVSSQSLINHSTYFSCKQPPGQLPRTYGSGYDLVHVA